MAARKNVNVFRQKRIDKTSKECYNNNRKRGKKDMTLIMTPVESSEFELLEAYCLGKGKLWNMFFGWRKTVDKGVNGEWAYYKLNRKDYKAIQLKAETMEEKNNF